MPYIVQCPGCDNQMPMSDNVFTERIVGKKVSIRCKECLKLITLDGTNPSELAKLVKATGDAPNTQAAAARTETPSADEDRPTVATSLRSPAPAQNAGFPTVAPPDTKRAQRPPPPPPRRLGGKTLLGLPPLPPTPPRPAAVPAAPASAPAASATPLPAAVPSSSANSQVPTKRDVPASPAASGVVLDTTSQKDDDELPPTKRPPPESGVVAPAIPGTAGLPKDAARMAELTPSGMAIDGQAPQSADVSSIGAPRRSLASIRRMRVAFVAAAAVIGGGGALVFARGHLGTPAPAPITAAKPVLPAKATATAVAAAEPVAAPQATAPAQKTLEGADEKKTEPSKSDSTEAANDKPAPGGDGTGLPSYVSGAQVLASVGSVLHRAQRCHPGGHAVGTADVIITFGPKGHVTEVRIEGEPIASAPVANCIRDFARSVIIPKFDGEPFTVRQQITMR